MICGQNIDNTISKYAELIMMVTKKKKVGVYWFETKARENKRRLEHGGWIASSMTSTRR